MPPSQVPPSGNLSNHDLYGISAALRLDVFDMIIRAKSGHIDSSLSVIDILTTLYFAVMRVKPCDPAWPDRDRLILSKGHAAPALYSVLARLGFFPREDLWTLRQPGSHLQGHPRLSTPGIDSPSGSLGQGLSVATGMAFASQTLHTAPNSRVFAVLSDGELDEGQTWEALALAGSCGLSRLTAIVDHNGRQYAGLIRDSSSIERLVPRLASLGWDVVVVDGHSFGQLQEALPRQGSRPLAVLARTIKGKGVSFMEDTLEWHGKIPTADQARQARIELVSAIENNNSRL